jgi:hypothetical protein
MWSAFARLTLLALCAGCGPRQLALSVTVDGSGCALSLPAGGSILYQVSANGIGGDAGAATVCGGCLAVDQPLAGADELVSFLERSAPSCAGVHPGTSLGVRLTGWSAAACPPASASFCADGPPVTVPDGTHDATVKLPLACHAQCAGACQPITCAAVGKDCGPISDGCNRVLECGDCKPPLRCAGAGVANVCGR